MQVDYSIDIKVDIPFSFLGSSFSVMALSLLAGVESGLIDGHVGHV